MKKKLLVGLVASMFAMSLAGCGGSDSPATDWSKYLAVAGGNATVEYGDAIALVNTATEKLPEGYKIQALSDDTPEESGEYNVRYGIVDKDGNVVYILNVKYNVTVTGEPEPAPADPVFDFSGIRIDYSHETYNPEDGSESNMDMSGYVWHVNENGYITLESEDGQYSSIKFTAQDIIDIISMFITTEESEELPDETGPLGRPRLADEDPSHFQELIQGLLKEFGEVVGKAMETVQYVVQETYSYEEDYEEGSKTYTVSGVAIAEVLETIKNLSVNTGPLAAPASEPEPVDPDPVDPDSDPEEESSTLDVIIAALKSFSAQLVLKGYEVRASDTGPLAAPASEEPVDPEKQYELVGKPNAGELRVSVMGLEIVGKVTVTNHEKPEPNENGSYVANEINGELEVMGLTFVLSVEDYHSLAEDDESVKTVISVGSKAGDAVTELGHFEVLYSEIGFTGVGTFGEYKLEVAFNQLGEDGELVSGIKVSQEVKEPEEPVAAPAGDPVDPEPEEKQYQVIADLSFVQTVTDDAATYVIKLEVSGIEVAKLTVVVNEDGSYSVQGNITNAVIQVSYTGASFDFLLFSRKDMSVAPKGADENLNETALGMLEIKYEFGLGGLGAEIKYFDPERFFIATYVGGCVALAYDDENVRVVVAVDYADKIISVTVGQNPHEMDDETVKFESVDSITVAYVESLPSGVVLSAKNATDIADIIPLLSALLEGGLQLA